VPGFWLLPSPSARHRLGPHVRAPAALSPCRSRTPCSGRFFNASLSHRRKGPKSSGGERLLMGQGPCVTGSSRCPLAPRPASIDRPSMNPRSFWSSATLIGDPQTGKTPPAASTLYPQPEGSGGECIYFAIGQRARRWPRRENPARCTRRNGHPVVVVAPAPRSGAVQVPRSLCGLRHGPQLDGHASTPHHLRRPLQQPSLRRLPCCCACPPAASLPGRRLLPSTSGCARGGQAVR